MLCDFKLDPQQDIREEGHENTSITYVNFFAAVTSIMGLLKNMVELGLWTDERDVEIRNAEERELLEKLIKILKISQSRESVNYKMPILKIIMFYLNQDRYEKVTEIVKSLHS